MADNTHTIEFGEHRIEVPRWATEETLKKIAELTSTSKLMTSIIAKAIKKDEVNLTDIVPDIVTIARAYDTSSDSVTNAKKKSLDKKLLGAAKSTKNVVDKFSNTDAPLTAMTEMLGDMGNAIAGNVKGMRSDTDSMSRKGKAINFAGKAVAGLGAGGLMWAAFQAGQIEQFAKAQETMINSGAIMFGDTSPYETLKQSAIASGLTYTELSKIVSQNGMAIQSLGNGVSSGTTAFMSMFKSVNKTGDKFGDYGLRSAEMSEVLANYINIQRMTSSKDMALLSTQDDVESGFHNLMIETTALASLTGQNRSELLQKQMAALSEPSVAAALKRMKEHGGGHAAVAESMIGQFALMESSMGPVGKNVSDLFNSYLFKKSDSMESYDLNEAFQGTKFAGAIEGLNHGFIEQVNSVMRSGDVEGAENLIINGFAEFRNGQLGSSNALAGSVQDIMHQLAVSGNTIHVTMKNRREMTNVEYKDYLKQIETKLETSGQMTESMNKMKTAFLTIQDSFVYNLDEASEMAEKLGNGIKSGAEKIKDISDWISGDRNSEDLLMPKGDDESLRNYQIRMREAKLRQEGNEAELEWFMQNVSIPAAQQQADGVLTDNTEKTVTQTTSPAAQQQQAMQSQPDNNTEKTVTQTTSDDPKMSELEIAIQNNEKFVKARTERRHAQAQKLLLEKTQAQNLLLEQNKSLSDDKPLEGKQFGGPVTKDKPYMVGEKGPELFTPTSHGSITDTNKTKMMTANPNNSDNDILLNLDDILKTKEQTIMLLKQMKVAMKSIQRSKDYQRAVDNIV